MTITEGYLEHPVFRMISETAEELGVRAFVIGGYVRDCFLGRPNKDIDIVVEMPGKAHPAQLPGKANQAMQPGQANQVMQPGQAPPAHPSGKAPQAQPLVQAPPSQPHSGEVRPGILLAEAVAAKCHSKVSVFRNFGTAMLRYRGKNPASAEWPWTPPGRGRTACRRCAKRTSPRPG